MSRFNPQVGAVDTSNFINVGQQAQQGRNRAFDRQIETQRLRSDIVERTNQNRLDANQQAIELEALRLENEQALRALTERLFSVKSNILQSRQTYLTDRRGQDISAATAERGQDITAGVAERGQDISAAESTLDRIAAQEENAADRGSRERVAQIREIAAGQRQQAEFGQRVDENEQTQKSILERIDAEHENRVALFQQELANNPETLGATSQMAIQAANGQDANGESASYEDVGTAVTILRDTNPQQAAALERGQNLRFLRDVETDMADNLIDGISPNELKDLVEKSQYTSIEMQQLFNEMILSDPNLNTSTLPEGFFAEQFNATNTFLNTFQSAISNEKVQRFVERAKRLILTPPPELPEPVAEPEVAPPPQIFRNGVQINP